MRGDGADSLVAEQVVAEIRRAGGVAVASSDSVASPEGGEAIVQTALDRFGRLDAVVSNAGIFNTIAFDALPAEEWRRMLNVHLDGGFYLSQPAFKVMKHQGYGRFVFIASSAGLFGQPDQPTTPPQGRPRRPHQRRGHRRRATRNPRQQRAALRLLRMVTETVGDRDQFPAESPSSMPSNQTWSSRSWCSSPVGNVR